MYTYNFVAEQIEPIDLFECTVGHLLLAECGKCLPAKLTGLSHVKLDYLTMSAHQVVQRDLHLYIQLTLSVNQQTKLINLSLLTLGFDFFVEVSDV